MNTLRPDELSSLSQIERNKRKDSLIKKGAGAVVGAGATLLGAGLASKVMPFLNEFVPVELALKGINKVSPQIGQFLKKGQSMGLNVQQGLQFLKNNLQPNQSNQPAQQANPLQEFETNYPDIAQALNGYIQQGQSPDAAAAILKSSTPFGKKIKDLEKNVGKNFIDYVLELFGNPQQQVSQQLQQSAPQAQPQMQQPQQGQQAGGINPDLLQIMNGIRSAMQNLSGTP
jgi:hypothetical protein